MEIFNSCDSRSKKLKINSLLMLFMKGISILISFYLLPLTVNYVSSSTYGIWLTLSSIVSWMSFFDIGLNNGLRNKYAECKAKGNMLLAKKYVSTTYGILCLIFIPIAIICLVVNYYVNWGQMLNLSTVQSINNSVTIIILYFCSNFILSTISVIMIADQRPALSSLLNFLQQILILLLIIVLVHYTKGSLLKLCIALCMAPLLVSFFFNIIGFKTKYKEVCPSFKYIDFSYTKDLLSLGFKFFVVQIAVVVLFQSSNFIMIKYYGADTVTQYNVAYKYFFSINMIFSIIITPLWSAATDAYTNGDIKWIKKELKKYTLILIAFICCAILMLVFSSFVYKIWMKDSITEIPFSISATVAFFVIESMFANLFVYFLNGAGILRLQFLFCILSPLVFIILCVLFIKYLSLGVYCIPLAIILSNLYGLIIAPIQAYLVFFKNRKGIWIK